MEGQLLEQRSAGDHSTAFGESPYWFLCDGTLVKLTFLREERTLQDQLVQYFVSRKRGRMRFPSGGEKEQG